MVGKHDFFQPFRFHSLHGLTYYLIDVLWGQPIKLVQVASTSELLENQRNNLVFFKIGTLAGTSEMARRYDREQFQRKEG